MNRIKATDWLSRFKVEITSNSNKVFGNGRQQIEVSVSIVPKAGITITQEQLDSIRLVTLDDDGNVQALSGDLTVSTSRNSQFEYYGDTGAAPSPLQETKPIRRRFYVSSTRSGGSLDTLYAAIRKDVDMEYVSHISSFNSSVVLETLTPLRLVREDFTWSVEDNDERTLGDTLWDYDVYQLFLKGRNLRLVKSIAYGAASGAAYYQKFEEEEDGWFEEGETTWSWTHFAYEISPLQQFHVPDNAVISVNRRPGSMVFIRIKTIGSVSLTGVHNTPSRWGLLDQYGNEHKVEMTQTSHGNLIDFRMME